MGSKRPHDDVEGDGGAAAAAATAPPEAKKRKGFRVGPDNLPDGAWKRKNTKIKHELIHKAKLKKDYAKVKAELAKEREEAAQAGSRPAAAALDAATEEPQVHPDRQLQMDDRQHVNPERQAFLDGVGGGRAPAPPRRQTKREGEDEESTSAQTGQDGPRQGEHGEDGPANTTTTTTTTTSPLEAPTSSGRRPRRENRRRRPDYYEKALEEGNRKKAEAEARAAEAERREKERARSIDERERTRRAMLKAKGFSASGRPRGKPKLGRESKVLLDKVKRIVGA